MGIGERWKTTHADKINNEMGNLCNINKIRLSKGKLKRHDMP